MPNGLSTPTSALKANAQAMNAAAQAVADSSTIGAKETTVYFGSMVAGNGGPSNGAGIIATGVQDVARQGGLETSTSETHMAISGNGYLPVSTSNLTKNIAYTRAGHFAPDKDGNLCNAAGFYLLGWPTDENGNVPANVNKSDISSLVYVNVNRVSGLAKATENLQLGLNLPSTAPVGAGSVQIGSASIYDGLGAKHNLLLRWERTSITPSTWSLSITCPDGAVYKGDGDDLYSGDTALTVTFDGEGRPAQFGPDPNTPPPNIRIVWNPEVTNAQATDIKFNLGTIGALDGISCRAGDYQISGESQDGRAFGTFRNVNINQDGKISAIYSNGQSVIIGRIALANFAAPNQLEAQSGNSYIETDASGTYVLSEPRVGGFGKIVSNALESSTVDLATTLTRLIELQTHYRANTKVVTAYIEEFRDLMAVF